MIIGNDKEKVIENIKKCITKGEYNNKVEVNDPNLSSEEKNQIIQKYLKNRKKLSYTINNKISRTIISGVTLTQIINTKIVGIENIENIKTGAIITSNHFNPLDNIMVRRFVRKMGKKRLYIVCQETNLAMDGLIGYIMNYADIIPISNQLSYMKKDFPETLTKLLNKNNFILIYPEQEMWFNYRKPRLPKPGAYYYAAKNNVPVISCFVEMIDKDKKENEDFNKVKYIIHILNPIYPDSQKTAKENSIIMMQKDYEQKKEAYEMAYNKKLDYTFEKEDIAGWITDDEEIY